MRKILNLSFSKAGGAGVIAHSLTQAQRALGFDSEFIYVSGAGVASNAIKNFKVLNQAIIDKVLVQKKESFSLFSLFRNDRKVSELLNSDDYIINLHWTPGLINLEDINYLNSQQHRYFWTLHDMWPLTGGCHYAFECKKFENDCSGCPQANRIFHRLIAKSKEDKRRSFYNENLIVVTPSQWLAELAKSSQNFHAANIRVINNGIDLSKFKPKENISKSNKLVIGLCASDLSDQRKGIQKAIDSIEAWISLRKSSLDVEILLQGNNFSKIQNSKLKLRQSRYSSDQIENFYNSIDIFVSLSSAENFPTTVLEAQACGVPSIVSNLGGAKEIVEEGLSGFVTNSNEQFHTALDRLLDESIRNKFSMHARERAERKFSLLEMAKKYIELYEE